MKPRVVKRRNTVKVIRRFWGIYDKEKGDVLESLHETRDDARLEKREIELLHGWSNQWATIIPLTETIEYEIPKHCQH